MASKDPLTSTPLKTPSISRPSSTSLFVKRAAIGLFVAQAAYLTYNHITASSFTTTAKMPRAPVIVLSHGGGPMPILNEPGHADIIRSLKERVPKVLSLGTPQQPAAIALVTAHWQTDVPTISSSEKHPLLYDYYGFPPESYNLSYPAPGSPEIANQIATALTAEGLKHKLDPARGWDHGVFVPMLLIDPKASIPIIQVSILRSEDPDQHIRLGKALSTLRDQNIAILGSGFASMHNFSHMRALMGSGSFTMNDIQGMNAKFNKAIHEALAIEKREDRAKAIAKWRDLPHADDMHPRNGGDHFMPLLVGAGAALDEKVETYVDKWLGLDIYTFFWGADPVA